MRANCHWENSKVFCISLLNPHPSLINFDMKYIDADKLRAEIKKLQDIFVETAKEMETEDEATVYSMCAVEFGDELLSFLDTLPDESEQPTKGYDEAYLNEKIAKASKSWEGVDVDKFMDEIRGREPVSDDLEKAANVFANQDCVTFISRKKGFKAGAEWGAEHLAGVRKMMSDDLEEAADEYSGCPNTGFIDTTAYFAFKAGAEWQKNQFEKKES